MEKERKKEKESSTTSSSFLSGANLQVEEIIL